MSDELTSIYQASNVQDAHILKNLLEQVGIPAMVDNDATATMGELPNNAKVLVPQVHVEAARKLVADFDDPDRDANAARGNKDDDHEDEAYETLPSWPLCPSCRKPRITLCPVCETSGTEFPAADPEPGEEAATRVICPTCDEPFEPEFYRLCEWCEHEFDDGIVLATPGPRAPANMRVIGLSLFLGGMAVALATYFLVIAR